MASAARGKGAALIAPGARLRDVCEAVEDEIRRLGAHPCFPAQSSRNQVAAHYCPSPEDETSYAEGDLAKLDIGVHVDGWVVDTAVTVNVGDRPENRPMIEAARVALESAVAAAGPGVAVRRISSVIESVVLSFGLRPMRNLCGHGVGRWVVHCPPPIPNLAEMDTGSALAAGAVVAIEPFATDGLGIVIEEGPPEVFRMDPRWSARAQAAPPEMRPVVEAIRAFLGLPFARRQLKAFPRGLLEATLRWLREGGGLQEYAPLVETSGRSVAQAEHTIHVGERGVEVLTR